MTICTQLTDKYIFHSWTHLSSIFLHIYIKLHLSSINQTINRRNKSICTQYWAKHGILELTRENRQKPLEIIENYLFPVENRQKPMKTEDPGRNRRRSRFTEETERFLRGSGGFRGCDGGFSSDGGGPDGGGCGECSGRVGAHGNPTFRVKTELGR